MGYSSTPLRTTDHPSVRNRGSRNLRPSLHRMWVDLRRLGSFVTSRLTRHLCFRKYPVGPKTYRTYPGSPRKYRGPVCVNRWFDSLSDPCGVHYLLHLPGSVPFTSYTVSEFPGLSSTPFPTVQGPSLEVGKGSFWCLLWSSSGVGVDSRLWVVPWPGWGRQWEGPSVVWLSSLVPGYA